MRFEEGDQTISVAVLLTLSGGFLDAFTYIGHNHVFANTMTGNIVLLGVSLASGNWEQAAHHIPPLVAFILAVLVIHILSMPKVERRIPRPTYGIAGRGHREQHRALHTNAGAAPGTYRG